MVEYYLIWLLGGCALTCNKKIVHVPIFIILTLFCGFRYNIIGYDYSVYQEHFNTIKASTAYIEQLYKYEWGYFLLTKIVSNFNISFSSFMFIIACFYHYALYKFSRSLKYSGLFIFLFISFFYMWQAYVITRQSIAIAIMFLYFSHYPLESKTPRLISKQNLYFTLSIILASLFHLSALIFLIIQGLHYLQLRFLSKKNIFLLGILCILSLIFCIYFDIFSSIKSRLDYYLLSDKQSHASIMNVLEFIFLIVIYIIYNKNKPLRHKTLLLYINFGLISAILGYTISEIFIRIGEYFKFALVMLYCEIYVSIAHRHKFFYLFILIILSGIRYLRFFNNFHPQHLVAYQYIIPF